MSKMSEEIKAESASKTSLLELVRVVLYNTAVLINILGPIFITTITIILATQYLFG